MAGVLTNGESLELNQLIDEWVSKNGWGGSINVRSFQDSMEGFIEKVITGRLGPIAQELENVKGGTARLRNQRDIALKDLKELRAMRDDLEKRLEAAESAAVGAQAMASCLEEQLEESRNQVAAMSERVDEARADADQQAKNWKVVADGHAGQLAALEQRIESLAHQRENMKSELLKAERNALAQMKLIDEAGIPFRSPVDGLLMSIAKVIKAYQETAKQRDQLFFAINPIMMAISSSRAKKEIHLIEVTSEAAIELSKMMSRVRMSEYGIIPPGEQETRASVGLASGKDSVDGKLEREDGASHTVSHRAAQQRKRVAATINANDHKELTEFLCRNPPAQLVILHVDALVGEKTKLAQAFEREHCAMLVENGNFIHRDSPEARWGRAAANAIRRRDETFTRDSVFPVQESAAWKEIRRLIAINAMHRDGKHLQDLEPRNVLDAAMGEFMELAKSPDDPGELADLFGVLIHYAIKMEWTPTKLEELLLKKLALRFTHVGEV